MLPALFRRDLVVRSVGIGLLIVAATCLHALIIGPATRGAGGWPAVLEAAIGFTGSCLGAVLLLLGRHIHDRVTVSARWARVRSGAATQDACSLPPTR